MRHALMVWVFCVVGVISFPVGAGATPVVVGSTYDAMVFDNVGTELFHTFTFDGLPETVLLGNGTHVTMTESETALGPGAWAIEFLLTADGPIFSSSSTQFYFNIGGFSNPVDLEFPLDPTASILTYEDGAGNVLASGSWGAPASPWNGYWPTGSGVGGAWIGNFKTTQSIELTIDAVTPVPEPATLTLTVFGLIGAGMKCWRHRRSIA